MTELLLELFSEEIPHSMQKIACDFLENSVRSEISQITSNKLSFKTYSTPHRITLHIDGLPKKITLTAKKIKGPKTSAPEKALSGFLKKNNINSVKELITEKLKNEEYYFYQTKEISEKINDQLKNILTNSIESLSRNWPKSMRWGNYKIRWVRPLHNILCIFDGNVLTVTFGHLTANNYSFGHRFLSNKKKFSVNSFKNYQESLEKNYVILDHEARKSLIQDQLELQAKKLKIELVTDDNLLAEVSNIVEYPVVMHGEIDQYFMSLPVEVIQTVMRKHQKYFCTRNKSDKLAPYFLFVSNIDAKNHNKNIIAGNEKVLSARLADAKYFYDTDLYRTLESRVDDLEKIIFHEDIGNLKQKTSNITILAKFISVWVPHANLVEVEKATYLSKADLTTNMVNELPELQGIIGYYYALVAGIDEHIAAAIKEHYLPRFSGDKCPTNNIAVAIALADRFDSLAALFAIGQRPSGSKDPYALRRMAISICNIIIENKLPIPLQIVIDKSLANYSKILQSSNCEFPKEFKNYTQYLQFSILDFIIERFKIILKSNDISHDIVNAVFSLGVTDNIVLLFEKALLLDKMLKTKSGRIAINALKRANNIYRKAEKDDNASYEKKPNKSLLKEPEEKILYEINDNLKHDLTILLKEDNYHEALKKIEILSKPISDFFDKITVNDSNKSLRQNRLKLLATLCQTVNNVANFSDIES